MNGQSLALLILFSSAITIRAEDTPAESEKQDKVPVVQKLVAQQAEVDIILRKNAPESCLQQGVCLVIAGLVHGPDELIHSPGLQRLTQYQLQRQEFSTKPENPDKSEWKPFDIAGSITVISHSKYYQKNLLPIALLHPVLTVPLPKLKSGDWPMAVVHPDLRKSLKDPPKETVEFRKIDFGVTTGHYYRYRVRLATGDAQGRQVWGDWSQPSKLKQIEPAAKK